MCACEMALMSEKVTEQGWWAAKSVEDCTVASSSRSFSLRMLSTRSLARSVRTSKLVSIAISLSFLGGVHCCEKQLLQF